MSDGLSSASTVIRGLAALLAFFPGIAVLLGLVDIPPTLMDLVRVISFSIGLIVLACVFLMRERIRNVRNGRAALYAVIAVVVGAACATAYYQFATAHTVVVHFQGEPDENGRPTVVTERYIIPLRPSAEVTSRVEPFLGDYGEAIRMSAQSELLIAAMARESGLAVLIMIVLLVLAEVLLVAPIVAAAWKLAGAPPVGVSSADIPPADQP